MDLPDILFGSSEDEPARTTGDNPIPNGIIQTVEDEYSASLADSPHSLTELLDAVQRYIWSTEYASRPGNAFFEQLSHEFNDTESLREPLLVEGDTLFALILGEGWADISANTSVDGRSGLTEAEGDAVQEAHSRFASTVGLEDYAALAGVAAIQFRNEKRLEEFIELVGLEDDEVNRARKTS